MKTSGGQHRARPPVRREFLQLSVLCLCAALSAPVSAQDEITPFRISDVSADFNVGYTLDDRNLGSGYTRSYMWTEELYFRTRSYVYHPALLDIKVGGGPVLVQGNYETDNGTNEGTDTLFNYDANFSFLERKTWPFSLYVRRDHPEVTTGILGRFLIRTDEYGVKGVLRPAALPFTAVWDAGHVTSEGSGFGSTVDESQDRASVRLAMPYLDAQNLALNVDWNRRNSGSGARGLPIQESLTKTLGTRLTSDNVFGEQKNVRFGQYLQLNRQDTTTDRQTNVDTFSYFGNLRWNRSADMTFFSDYAYTDQDRTESWTRSQKLNGGMQYHADSGLALSGTGRYSSSDDPSFSRDRTGIQLSARQQFDLAFGTLSVSASAGADRTDQRADARTSSVFEETHELAGVVPVTLEQNFVIEDTVVVTNAARTQTFIPNLDYRLITIGSGTTIERIATGNIADGEIVLVSYEYRTGGTANYDTLTQSLAANLSLSKNLHLYAQLGATENDVRSGVLTTPLNDLVRFEVGGRFEYPLKAGWSLGGELRYTRQDEDISPFTRTHYDVFAQTGNYWGLNMRFGLFAEQVDYEVSREDVDLLRYFATVSCKLPGSARLTFRIVSSEDDGGTIARKDLRKSLNFDWRYRMVVFSLRAEQSDVSQGSSRRDHTRVVADFRRSF